MARSLCVSLGRLFTLLLLTLSLSVQATSKVELNYMLNCQGCHLPDGSGFAARGVPSLKGHMAKFLQVPGGREFLVQVPGSAMSDLNDIELAVLLNWMLVKFNPADIPAGFQSYSAPELTELRKQPLLEVTHKRQQLLEKIQLQEANNNE